MHHGGQEFEHRWQWTPKMDFIKFDESDVRIWLDKCVAYFNLYSVPPGFRVTVASIHMIDKAAHWY
jgi:hypothetical protein